jgi:hypothetical protein
VINISYSYTTNPIFEQDETSLKLFNTAFDQLFVLDSGASYASNQELCRKTVKDLLIRQNIPLNHTTLRNLDLVALYKISFMAGLTGITNWKRDDFNKIKLTDYGFPIQDSNPSNIETDIMTCIICALLIIISTFHIFQYKQQKN